MYFQGNYRVQKMRALGLSVYYFDSMCARNIRGILRKKWT